MAIFQSSRDSSFLSENDFLTKMIETYLELNPEVDGEAVREGSRLSDIGKKPDCLPPEEAELVERMYAVENVPSGHLLSVGEFLDKYCQGEADKGTWTRIVHYRWKGPDVDALDIRMPEFWSFMHPEFTLRMIDRECPRHSTSSFFAAVLHHLMEGCNPEGVCRGNGHLYFAGMRQGGIDGHLGVEEAAVIVFDKYDAFRNRSGFSKEETLGIMKGMVANSKGLAAVLTEASALAEFKGHLNGVLAHLEMHGE